MGLPKRKLVFQPSISRCENDSFRECTYRDCQPWISAMIHDVFHPETWRFNQSNIAPWFDPFVGGWFHTVDGSEIRRINHLGCRTPFTCYFINDEIKCQPHNWWCKKTHEKMVLFLKMLTGWPRISEASTSRVNPETGSGNFGFPNGWSHSMAEMHGGWC